MAIVNIGGELRKYLLADATLAAAFGDRITPNVIDQGPARPAAMYRTISAVASKGLAGVTGTQTKRLQFDVVATSDKQTQDLAGQMLERFAGFGRGLMNSRVWVQELDIASGVRSGESEPRDGSSDWDYWASFDVLVTYVTTLQGS